MSRSGRAGAAGAPARGAPVVVVATTPGCRHCARAKAALGEAGVAFEEADVSSPQAAGLRVAVAAAAGGDRAVPQAFGLGRHLGNADALVAGLGDGALAEELHRAAPPPELPEGVGVALLELREAEMGAGPKAAEDAGAELIRGLRQDWRAVGGGGGDGKVSGAEVMRRLGGVADNAEARAGALLRSGLLAGPSPGGTSDINTGAEYSPVSPVWAPSGTDAALNSYLRWPFAPRPASEVAEALRERVERLYSKFLAPGGASVDYAGLSASPEFRTYCDAAAELQAVDLTGLRSNEERIAFWVNIYNALIVHGTALRGSPQTTPERLGFFAGLKYDIGGFTFSCDDVEHGVLRGNAPSPAAPGQLLGGLLRLDGRHPLMRVPWLNRPHFKNPDDPRRAFVCPLDPRIHFALNCGARSCPPIRVYSAATLEEGLAAAAAAFCEGEVEVDDATGTISLSKIFQWYGRDFAPDERGRLFAIAKFLPEARAAELRRVARREGGPRVHFRTYDWTPNAQ